MQLANITGGSYLTVPKYSNDRSALPTVTVPEMGLVWTLGNGFFMRYEAQYGQVRGLQPECRIFVRHRNGKVAASAGAHDDCVMAMAMALALWLREEMRRAT